jgi:hypothetical protein
MGNWMTVMIEGTCDEAEVGPLTEFLTAPDWRSDDDAGWDRLGPLSISEGLAGIGAWPARVMMRIGNCYERGYTPEDVAEQLRRCLEVAPSLDVKVHCGGDYESLKVRASVLCRGGEVGVGEPAREEIPPIPEDQMLGNLLKALSR